MIALIAAALPAAGALVFARTRTTRRSASRCIAEWVATWLVRVACMIVALAGAVEQFGPNFVREYRERWEKLNG